MNEAERGIAQRGECLRRGAGTDTAGILVQGDVAAPVQPVLDRPMLTGQARSSAGPVRSRDKLVTAYTTSQLILPPTSRVRSMRHTWANPGQPR